MRTELQDYLIKKFPKLYTDNIEDCQFKHFGFECGGGWFRLILWLSRYLQDYIDQQNVYAKKYPDQYLPVEQIKVLQVKEKFGTLRYYTSGGNERTKTVISFVEYISGFVCEFTGKTENIGINKKGWIKTQHVDGDFDSFKMIDDKELLDLLNNDEMK